MSNDPQPAQRAYAPHDLPPPKEAAAVLRTAAGTLANHRTKGTGPEYVKLGRIFYPYECLLDYIELAKRRSTSEVRVAMLGKVICTNEVTK